MKPMALLAFICRLLALAALGLAVWNVAHRLVAYRIADTSPTVQGLDDAISWDPLNPELHLARSRLLRTDLREGRDAAAMKDLERAVSLNPWNWAYWGELATLLEGMGDMGGARRAYLRAAEESPLSGYTRWNLANFQLRRGERQEWLRELGAAVASDGTYRDPAALLLLKLDVAPDEVAAVWPDTREALLPLARFLVQRSGGEARELTSPNHLRLLWARILRFPEPLQPRDAQFYLDYLMQSGRYEEARAGWVALMHHNGAETGDFGAKKNYVWNGDFETAPCNRLFCWLFDTSNDYSIHWTTGKDEDFSRQMRIEFPGDENLFFQGLRQMVVVDPDSDYEVSFRARTEAITSDRGIYLQVRDPETGATAETEELLGTRAWARYTAHFHVPATSTVVALTFRREKSRRLAGKLSGTVWVDDVTLTPSR